VKTFDNQLLVFGKKREKISTNMFSAGITSKAFFQVAGRLEKEDWNS
jgi:hypothetical protein